MTLQTPRTASEEWKACWPLVLTTCVGFSFHSIAIYSSGLFIEPIQAEMGWSRGQISAGLAIAAMATVPLSPLFGALIDKWGSRRIALPGLLLTACALASFGTTSNSMTHWIALWCAYALVGLSVKSTVWTYAISSNFSAGRGLALAVMLSGTALAQSLVPPIAQWLIATVGWRAAWAWMGFGWCVPAFVMAWFFLKDAPKQDRVQTTAQVANTAAGSALPSTIGQALRNPPLLKLGAATAIMMILGLGVIIHQVPILTDLGISRETAAWVASLAGVAGISGKLITGALMDRMDGAKVGAVTIALASVGFAALLMPPTLFTVMLGCTIIGYAVGTKLQISAYLTSQMTDMSSFGKIFGLMNSVVAFSAGFGPLLSSLIFDWFGTYRPLIWVSIPGSLISAYLIYSCRSLKPALGKDEAVERARA